MEIIYQKNQQISKNLILNNIFGVYGKQVFCIQKFKKQGHVVMVRAGKVLDSVKDYEAIESKLFLVGDELIADPIYISATNSLDLADCENNQFHMCFYPDANLILSIKKYYLDQVAKNVL